MMMPASAHPERNLEKRSSQTIRAQAPGLKWRILISRGWRARAGEKKSKRRRKTGPQLSHDKLSFPDDVNSRSMKDKVRDVEFCCKHNSEDITIFLKNHIANFMCFQISLKKNNCTESNEWHFMNSRSGYKQPRLWKRPRWCCYLQLECGLKSGSKPRNPEILAAWGENSEASPASNMNPEAIWIWHVFQSLGASSVLK